MKFPSFGESFDKDGEPVDPVEAGGIDHTLDVVGPDSGLIVHGPEDEVDGDFYNDPEDAVPPPIKTDKPNIVLEGVDHTVNATESEGENIEMVPIQGGSYEGRKKVDVPYVPWAPHTSKRGEQKPPYKNKRRQ